MEKTVNTFIEVMKIAFELSQKITQENPDVNIIDWSIRITGRNGVNAEINRRLTEAMVEAGLTV